MRGDAPTQFLPSIELESVYDELNELPRAYSLSGTKVPRGAKTLEIIANGDELIWTRGLAEDIKKEMSRATYLDLQDELSVICGQGKAQILHGDEIAYTLIPINPTNYNSNTSESKHLFIVTERDCYEGYEILLDQYENKLRRKIMPEVPAEHEPLSA
jgi:hypothetical protein